MKQSDQSENGKRQWICSPWATLYHLKWPNTVAEAATKCQQRWWTTTKCQRAGHLKRPAVSISDDFIIKLEQRRMLQQLYCQRLCIITHWDCNKYPTDCLIVIIYWFYELLTIWSEARLYLSIGELTILVNILLKGRGPHEKGLLSSRRMHYFKSTHPTTTSTISKAYSRGSPSIQSLL